MTNFKLFLGVLVLLLLVRQGTSCAWENCGSDGKERMAKLADMKNVGGLSGWAAIGSGIRGLALAGPLPIDSIVSGIGGGGDNSGSNGGSSGGSGDGSGDPTRRDDSGSSSSSGSNGGSGDGSGDPMGAMTPIITYLAPIIALIGICIVFTILTLLICPIFYCCRGCGNCGGNVPKQGGYTKNEKICALVTLGVGFIFIFVGFVLGLVSNSLVTDGIANLPYTIDQTFSDVQELPDRISGGVDNVLNNFETTIDDIFDLIEDVPNLVLGNTGQLTLFINNLTDQLVAVQIAFDSFKAQGLDIDSTIQKLSISIDSLNDAIDALNQQVADLSTPKPIGTNPDHYSFKTECGLTTLPITTPNITGLLPSFSSLIASVNISLNDTADMIQDQFGTINQNITDMISEQLSGFKNQINDIVNSTSSTVDGLLESVTSIFAEIDTYKGMVNQYYSEPLFNGISIEQVFNGRKIATAVFFSLSALALLICAIGLGFKKSWIMTCSAVLCFFLIALFWLLCALHLIIAAPSGKLCEIVLDPNELLATIPENLLAGIGGGNDNSGSKREYISHIDYHQVYQRDDGGSSGGFQDIFGNFSSPLFEPQEPSFYVHLFYDGLDYCHNGGNLVEYLNLTDALDFNQMIDPYIDQLNITSLLGGFNVTNQFSSQMNFTAGIDFNELFDTLVDMKDDFGTSLTVIDSLVVSVADSQLTNATDLIDSFAQNDTAISLCLDYDGTDTEAAINATRDDLEAISQGIKDLNTTQLQNIRGNLSELRLQLDAFADTANNTGPLFTRVLNTVTQIGSQLNQIQNSLIDTITDTTIPSARALITQFGGSIGNTLKNITECQAFANDILGTLHNVCILTVGGVDGIWVTCGFLGLVLIIGIVGITLSAKRFTPVDEFEHEFGDNYYSQEQEYELPPMYDSEVADAKS